VKTLTAFWVAALPRIFLNFLPAPVRLATGQHHLSLKNPSLIQTTGRPPVQMENLDA